MLFPFRMRIFAFPLHHTRMWKSFECYNVLCTTMFAAGTGIAIVVLRHSFAMCIFNPQSKIELQAHKAHGSFFELANGCGWEINEWREKKTLAHTRSYSFYTFCRNHSLVTLHGFIVVVVDKAFLVSLCVQRTVCCLSESCSRYSNWSVWACVSGSGSYSIDI